MIGIALTCVYVDAPLEVPTDVRDRILKGCNKMLDMPAYVLEAMHNDYRIKQEDSGMEHLFEYLCEAMEDALMDTPREYDLEVGVRCM